MDGLMLLGMFAAIIYFIVCIYKSNKFNKETNGMYRTKSNNDDDDWMTNPCYSYRAGNIYHNK